MCIKVQFLPSGEEISIRPDETLLDAALRAGLSPLHGCGTGNCGQCKARVVGGQPGRRRYHDFSFTAAEKLAGMVLLCCTGADTDLLVDAVVTGEQQSAAAPDMPVWEQPVRRVRQAR